MSKSNSGKEHSNRRLVLITIVAVFAALSIWTSYGHIHRTERKDAAKAYQNERLVKCESSGAASAAECKAQAAEAPYEKTKDAYDLKAQQDMAKWALLMLIATFAGVGLIAATLRDTGLVLDEARKATDAANRTVDETRKVGEAQVRGYLSYDNPRCEIGRSEIRFCVDLRNIGLSPIKMVGAKDLQVNFHITSPEAIIYEAVEHENQITGSKIGQIAGTKPKELSMQFRFTRDEVESILSLRRSFEIIVGVKGVFWYRDVFGKSLEDPFVYQGRILRGDLDSITDFLIILSDKTNIVRKAKEIREKKGYKN